MSKVIEINGTDVTATPDIHYFYVSDVVIAKVTCPITCPSSGELVRFGEVVYKIDEIIYNMEDNRVHYTMNRYGVFKKEDEV